MTNEQHVDVFIPCVYKDYQKLKFNITSMCIYFKQLHNIYISMPDKANISDMNINNHQILFFNDYDILPNISFPSNSFRKNWIYQQLLKLLQTKTQTEYFLVFDADCILLKPFSVFSDKNIPYLFEKEKINDESAFNRYIAHATKNDLAEDHGEDFVKSLYIADMQLFNRKYVDEMILKYFDSVQNFIDFTVSNSFWEGKHSTGIFISEYEMYGRYITKYHNDTVVHRKLKQFKVEKFQISQQQNVYSDIEIEKLLKYASELNEYDDILIQSGCCASDIKYAEQIS